MASWRVKGYVSDSEDEDGGVSVNDTTLANENQPAPPDISVAGLNSGEVVIGDDEQNGEEIRDPNHTADNGDNSQPDSATATDEPTAALNTADKLQESLQQVIGFASSTQQTPTIPDNKDQAQDDSPLSSPPDSPQSLRSIGQIPSGIDVLPVTEQPFLAVAAQRTFRQRTANQIQPYTIDRAKHIKDWSARGIKPVPLPRGRSPILGTAKSATEDSQFEESQSQVGDSISQDLMDLDVPPESSQPTGHDIYDLHFEDGLPDLASLLERRSPLSTKKSRRSTVLFNVLSSDSDHLSGATRRKNMIQNNQQDSLPSPPISLDHELSRPVDLTEDQESLPRAMPSSTARSRKRLVVEDDTQSTDEGQRLDPIQVVHVRNDTSSDESASEEEAVQVMQKRIKGVLPASWWTVEMAQRSLAAKKKQIGRLHASRTPHAGVAQRKISSHKQSRNTRTDDLEELLSSEASEHEVPDNQANVRSAANLDDHADRPTRSADDADDMDVIEENEIDFMLAPQSRMRASHDKSHTRSRAFGTSRSNAQERRHQPQFQVRAKQAQSRRPKRVKAKPTQGRVHVLDAPDLRSPKQNLPSFLKIASRQAKSRSKSSGTLASKKFFRLDSDDDDDSTTYGPNLTSLSTPNRGHDLESSTRKKHGQGKRLNPPTGLSAAVSSAVKSNADQPNGRVSAEVHYNQPLSTETVNRYDRSATLGYLVHCGPTDDATLRLTRLQSLLPLTNRSGNGNFAKHYQQPREAQIETSQPAIGLPIKPRQRVISTVPNTQVIRHDLDHVTINSNHPPRVIDLPLKHRKRKQVPVPRPKLRQKSLVAPSPDTKNLANLLGRTDTSVRDILEKEFNTHQAAWFQASRQDILFSNQETQLHFYTFLDVLRSYLPVALQDAEDERESRELRSFIHRLIPNRGQIGASGQVGNKTRSVHYYDILVAQNVFELHKCLLSLAPGAAPRPRVLEMKVNFADAHEEICLIALSTWRDICQMHINDLEIIHGLAAWLYSMLYQLANRWVAAETDAQKEIANLTHLTNAEVVRYTVEYNQKRVRDLFCKVLKSFTECVQEATSVTEARSLFRIRDFVQALGQLTSIDKLDSSVAEILFTVAAAYVSLPWMPAERDEVSQLTEATHKSFVVVTGSHCLSYATAHSLTKSFFTVAKSAIDQGQITWDHLLTSAARLSLDRLDPRQHNREHQNLEQQNRQEQNLMTIKAVFYHCLIEKATSYYELELRPTIISFWVLMLLEAKDQDQHWRLLTHSLFQHEAASIHMPRLALKFGEPGYINDTTLNDISISELRHAVVLHVIAEFHGQENEAEADEIPGGFELADANTLLNRMFDELRKNWQLLRTDLDQQDLYTLLIHAALRQFELCPRRDLIIDPWFYNPATFPQPVRNDLFQILSGSGGPEVDTVEKAKELFDLEIEQAGRFGRFESLQSKLRNVLIQQPEDSGHGSTAYNLVEHGKFFRLTLESYANNSSLHSIAAAEILVRGLIHLMENLHCRAEADDASLLEDFVQNISLTLSSLRALLMEALASLKTDIFKLARLIYSWTVACLHDIPYNLIDDVEAICEMASDDGSPQSLLLLDAIMATGQTVNA